MEDACESMAKVLQEKNLGEHIASVFSDEPQRLQKAGFRSVILLGGKVLRFYVTERFTAVDMPRPCLTLIPQCSLKEFWVPLTKFCTSKDAKNGSGGT